MILDWHERYTRLQLPKQFRIADVCERLQTVYGAVELDLNDLADALNDPHISSTDIKKVLLIERADVLQSLFSTEEQQLFAQFRASAEIATDDPQSAHWLALNSGLKLLVVLESDDERTLTGFTIQGHCMKLYHELCVLRGIDESDCVLGNEIYEQYLYSLNEAGYLV